ncbi:non-hydrolyzing UDP-N-acetylglucosamine 2-epimerase [Rhodopirellula sallentina]|uniref:UDP-N-acetylglucosamine 2-epimerase n=1 Tax=Rhodopirellula sallentina SM41 TaxID=1263870 RepID=M5U4Y5_9BACT|nr:UDP-N-acetylglucosamine 2-epimerase (non-hydrolyzing) [Rhodopirellula sallentina]EMI56510.1 UDP-N-acetylglucosamine 2-epimerase [Rhodopirellula sallentina SM41]
MDRQRLKVATILGTRPEIIRLARVMAALDRATDHVIVHTGQNYDYELNQIFFDELEIRKPNYFLGVDTSSLGNVLGGTLIETEKVLQKERPDAVLILGDTNSALAGIMARRMKIPLYHMEAGNRCFDFNVPEETNRRIVDAISDFNLVYTEHARRHLISEGFPQRRIYVTGSPMGEVLHHYADKIDASDALSRLGLTPQGYVLVSMHREENVDNAKSLSSLLLGLQSLAKDRNVPVVVSTHPRTLKRIEQFGTSGIETAEDPQLGKISLLKPFGFCDYNRLQKDALCVLSDSGTISEESSLLKFPAVTLRNAIERPEALDTGSILLTGTDPNRILDCVGHVIDDFDEGQFPPTPVDYQVTNCSQRVTRLILGTAKLAHRWMGIESAEDA